MGNSKIPFIGKHFLDGVVGMTAAGDAKREVGAVMEGGRGNICGKNETITGIDGGVLLDPEMGCVILDRPVRFEITEKLKDVAIFVQFTLRCFSYLPPFPISRTLTPKQRPFF